MHENCASSQVVVTYINTKEFLGINHNIIYHTLNNSKEVNQMEFCPKCGSERFDDCICKDCKYNSDKVQDQQDPRLMHTRSTNDPDEDQEYR
jgi:ribosomal protein L32